MQPTANLSVASHANLLEGVLVAIAAILEALFQTPALQAELAANPKLRKSLELLCRKLRNGEFAALVRRDIGMTAAAALSPADGDGACAVARDRTTTSRVTRPMGAWTVPPGDPRRATTKAGGDSGGGTFSRVYPNAITHV